MPASVIGEWRITTAAAEEGGALGNDNFNRADEQPMGGVWTQREDAGDVDIIGNRFSASTGADCAAYRNDLTPDDDQYAEVVLAVSGEGGYIGPMVRCATGSIDYYALFVGSVGDNNLYVSRWDAGTEASLAVIPYTHSVNDVIRLEVTGQSPVSLVAKVNGAQQGSTITDSHANRKLSGRFGVWGFSPNSSGDDWEGGNL